MLHQRVILFCFQNKILLYVCVRTYCKVTFFNLWHVYCVNCMWVLFCCIGGCCNLLSLIGFLPLFCKSKFYVNRNNLMNIITINIQSTTTGREFCLKTIIPVCLQSLERWSSLVWRFVRLQCQGMSNWSSGKERVDERIILRWNYYNEVRRCTWINWVCSVFSCR
jgi:hypothetical protein